VSEPRLTVREACRRRMPLDGTDAQALEHALVQLETERDALRERLKSAERCVDEWYLLPAKVITLQERVRELEGLREIDNELANRYIDRCKEQREQIQKLEGLLRGCRVWMLNRISARLGLDALKEREGLVLEIERIAALDAGPEQGEG